MLQVKNIHKAYKIGEMKYPALNGVSLNFRENEFVALLGESGSGKTTFLNIIGGLNQYDSGDIVIDGVTTKNYKDSDWDSYRNHKVGFVFQSYNLIPHLDLVTNVELALSLSGVTAQVRRERAIKILKRVGLEEHLTKKPSQLSGGQQQRVAIARALVNEPSIILADEPTGALDSETSEEIMNLLLEVAEGKLVIMVTHNPNLASKYADRIINIKDGEVTSDSNPYVVKETEVVQEPTEKTTMSLLTALSLSIKNLFTKKARTIITAIAGSIGIIGVALVLSLQYGFTNYLNKMERDTFAGLPITINQSYLDFSAISGAQRPGANLTPVDSGVGGYNPTSPFEEISGVNKVTNDYIDYLIDSGMENHSTIVLNHGYSAQYLSYSNNHFNLNPRTEAVPPFSAGRSYINQPMYHSEFFTEYFDILYENNYDENKNQAVLVLNDNNRLPYDLLSFLGFDIDNEDTVVSYEEIVGKKFYILTNDFLYKKDPLDANFYIPRTKEEMIELYTTDKSAIIEVEISQILKPNSAFITLSEQIIYNFTTKETIMDLQKESDVANFQVDKDYIVVKNDSLVQRLVSTPEEALVYFGYNQTPTDIYIYPNSFEDKEAILKILDQYNLMVETDGDDSTVPIKYTDNVASALSMMKTIMNTITVILVAFSSISLIVSSVMIGVIMYTSVLERTKEIGILRSIGARRKDISRVFNAEAISIGFFAGVLGVIITFGLVPIINIFIYNATEQANVAELFIGHAILLIGISILLTFISGLIPSSIASKKDPVNALRSE